MAYPAWMYRNPAFIVEEKEISELRRDRKPANPFEENMTADEILRQWARGEWDGSYPHPLPPRRCASAEGEYVPPSIHHKEPDDDSEDPPPINWKMHAHVDKYYKKLARRDQWILQAEYTRRHKYGNLTDNARHEKASRVLGMSVHYFKNRLEHMKIEIETTWRDR